MNNVRVSVKIRMGARVAPCIETPDQAGKFFCIFLFHPPKIKFWTRDSKYFFFLHEFFLSSIEISFNMILLTIFWSF